MKREGSHSKLRPQPTAREPSGELRTTGQRTKLASPSHGVTRQKSDIERRRPAAKDEGCSHGHSHGMVRQKSDGDSRRSVNYRTPDLAHIRSSGYGTPVATGSPVAMRKKRETSSGSLKGELYQRTTSRDSTDSTEDEKLYRQKSGDLLAKSTAPGSGMRRSVSKDDVKGRKSSDESKARTSSREEARPRPGALKLSTSSGEGSRSGSPVKDIAEQQSPTHKRPASRTSSKDDIPRIHEPAVSPTAVTHTDPQKSKAAGTRKSTGTTSTVPKSTRRPASKK